MERPKGKGDKEGPSGKSQMFVYSSHNTDMRIFQMIITCPGACGQRYASSLVAGGAWSLSSGGLSFWLARKRPQCGVLHCWPSLSGVPIGRKPPDPRPVSRRSREISTKSCRTSGSTSIPASPRSPASSYLTRA